MMSVLRASFWSNVNTKLSYCLNISSIIIHTFEAANPPNMFLVRDPKSKIVTHNGTFGEDGIFEDFEGTAYLPGYCLIFLY